MMVRSLAAGPINGAIQGDLEILGRKEDDFLSWELVGGFNPSEKY